MVFKWVDIQWVIITVKTIFLKKIFIKEFSLTDRCNPTLESSIAFSV